MVTPFRPNGGIDYAGLEKLIDHQITGGVDYVVSMGTTGESVTLTTAEKKQLLATTVELVRNRVPVVLGVGGNNTAEVIEKLHGFEMDGVDGILSVSPYYNKPTQEGIYQHFKAVAQASMRPIILYNVPGRTGSNMSADTTVRLAKDFSNVPRHVRSTCACWTSSTCSSPKAIRAASSTCSRPWASAATTCVCPWSTSAKAWRRSSTRRWPMRKW